MRYNYEHAEVGELKIRKINNRSYSESPGSLISFCAEGKSEDCIRGIILFSRLNCILTCYDDTKTGHCASRKFQCFRRRPLFYFQPSERETTHLLNIFNVRVFFVKKDATYHVAHQKYTHSMFQKKLLFWNSSGIQYR